MYNYNIMLKKKFLICNEDLLKSGKCKEENKIIIDDKNKKYDVLAEIFQINEKTEYPYKKNLKYEVKETGIHLILLYIIIFYIQYKIYILFLF